MKKFILTIFICLWSHSAVAHSPLNLTIPSDGSLITELPDKLILEFKGSVRLTLVTIKHNDNSKIKLNLNSSLGFVSKHNVPVSFKDTGSYFVEWRGLGTDGHTLKGSFEFNVK
jgi:methionine-rich copper-binding protein CopC